MQKSSTPQVPPVDVSQEWERALHAANERAAALTEQRQTEVEQAVRKKKKKKYHVYLSMHLCAQTAAIEKLRAELADRDERIALMQQTLDARPGDDATQKLLEQIHNERATVSRAVAQNRQLKEQQIELEDKIVVLVRSYHSFPSKRMSNTEQSKR